MSFEFESVNLSFQEVSQDLEPQHQSQSDTSELSDDELEQVNGGIAPLLLFGAGLVGRYVATKFVKSVVEEAVDHYNQ
ncbi:MAG: class IIb bacteriocin, lactobin A/cerein 7B family [Microcoleus sp. SU_5_3]|nr:class IIb bacteriocin, lactobin A/cerein 7B family [Microcoleus sp. SU_5_3]